MTAVGVAGACYDRTSTGPLIGPNQLNAPARKTVYYTPGSVPGKSTVTIGMGNADNGIDSVAWPDSFPDATRVRMTVIGHLSRIYNPALTGSWAYLKGTPYFPVDADGEAPANSCAGFIYTNFVHAYDTKNVNTCKSFSNPLTTVVDTYSITGVVRGKGKVARAGFAQASSPAPPNCNGPGGFKCEIATGGSQTVTIEPIPNLLTVSASPSNPYEGDSVTFTASSTPLALTVRKWTWVPDVEVDSNGTPTGVGPSPLTVQCAGTATTCRIPIYDQGKMYVTALVGSGGSQFLEQANVQVSVQPIVLKATFDRRFVGAGDSVRVTLSSVPAGKPMSSSTIAAGTAILTSASCLSVTLCRANVSASGTILLGATVYGITRSASVRVDTVACATGDSILDNPVMREMLKNLERLSNQTTPPKEMRGYLVQILPDGVEQFVIDSANSANTCIASGFRSSVIPTGYTLIFGAHIHPYTLGDSVQCLPAGQVGFYGRDPLNNKMPSAPDWAIVNEGFPQVVFDKDSLVRYNPTTLSDSIQVTHPDGTKTWDPLCQYDVRRFPSPI
ncbi:MAG: hypothetical protein ABJC26_04975 [Gemmatimonadaceae bacterium]